MKTFAHDDDVGWSLPPALSLEGGTLQGSRPPPAPHPGVGLSSSQKSPGRHGNRGAGTRNSRRRRGALPSCSKQ